jgi:hypothetical protein
MGEFNNMPCRSALLPHMLREIRIHQDPLFLALLKKTTRPGVFCRTGDEQAAARVFNFLRVCLICCIGSAITRMSDPVTP